MRSALVEHGVSEEHVEELGRLGLLEGFFNVVKKYGPEVAKLITEYGPTAAAVIIKFVTLIP
jgi:hypothetical protein